MLVALFADRRPRPGMIEWLKKYPDIELIITLGDLNYFDLRPLIGISIPKMGVYGNHDSSSDWEGIGIIDMHMRTASMGGFTWLGFEGGHRYKDGSYQYSQEESKKLLAQAPPVDIVIAHSPPYKIHDTIYDNDIAHIGFKGLRDYIKRYQPKFLFHGHTYPETRQTVYRQTTIHYVNGVSIVEISENGIELVDSDVDYLRPN